jgi:hypothetical protein
MTDQIEYDHHAELKEVKRQIEHTDRRLAEVALKLAGEQAALNTLYEHRRSLDFQVWKLEKQYKTEGSM